MVVFIYLLILDIPLRLNTKVAVLALDRSCYKVERGRLFGAQKKWKVEIK